MKGDLTGNVALITGGASGIGAASARKLAQRGVLLALVDKNEAGMRLVAGEITKAMGQEPAIITADLQQGTDVDGAVKQAFDRFGRIDILLNSAGISTHIKFLELSEDDWDRVLNVNLKATFLCCRAVAPIMVKQRRGAIVNMSSRFGFTGGINMAHYSASKAGVLALTKSMALELAPYGIRVNAIAPGPIDTPMFRGNRTEAQIREVPTRIPLGRIGQPDDIANGVSFLVGPESAYMTGQTLHINGGNFMS